LRRLLMVKGLLGEIHALTPTSDALAVARAILTAHDAAELALATLVDILGARPKDPAFLMNYAGALRDKLGDLAGHGFLSSLNEERVSFKHKGNLPNVQQWHRVGDNVRGYVEQWCHGHLGISLADLELDALIEDESARALYLDARARCDDSD